jgi:hypothetical protein
MLRYGTCFAPPRLPARSRHSRHSRHSRYRQHLTHTTQQQRPSASPCPGANYLSSPGFLSLRNMLRPWARTLSARIVLGFGLVARRKPLRHRLNALAIAGKTV